MITYRATRDTFVDQAVHYAAALAPRVLYEINVSTLRARRTTGPGSQNRHINGHCQQIAEETGCSFDAVKSFMKRAAVDMGYPYDTLPNGDIAPKSEAEIDTLQAGYLIDTIHRFAAEWGIGLDEG